MKPYKIPVIVGLLFSVVFYSCDDLLDPKAETNLTEEFANVSYNNTLARSIGLYSYLPDGLSYLDGAMMAAASDEAEYTLETASIHGFNVGSWNANNNPDGSAWERNFEGIFAANLFLKESDEVDLDYLKYDPTKQQDYQNRLNNIHRWKYEARFLRTYYYFELVKRYGGVPIITEPLGLKSDLSTFSRDSLSACIRFIVSECDSAAAVLQAPDRMTDVANNLGRATKGAAMGLKCRALLYAASDLFNKPEEWAPGYTHKEYISMQDGKSQQERWEEAAAACNDFITTLGNKYPMDEYRLIRDYQNGEIIFDRRYGSTNTFEKNNYPVGYNLGQSGNTPSQNLVDAYEMIDGTPFDWNNPEHKSNPYANRDPRLAMSILTNNVEFKDRTIEAWTGGRDGKGVIHATRTGYYIYKFIDPNLDLLQNRTSVHHWVIMRYAEILLSYAEAMNEAYGPTGNVGYRLNAVRALNQVRNRVGVEMPAVPTAISKEELREKIRNERRVELAFEDHRFWDVRRWMIAPETLGAPLRGVEITKISDEEFEYKPIEVEKRTFEPKMYLYPIPQADLNTTGWVQNPLW